MLGVLFKYCEPLSICRIVHSRHPLLRPLYTRCLRNIIVKYGNNSSTDSELVLDQQEHLSHSRITATFPARLLLDVASANKGTRMLFSKHLLGPSSDATSTIDKEYQRF